MWINLRYKSAIWKEKHTQKNKNKNVNKIVRGEKPVPSFNSLE